MVIGDDDIDPETLGVTDRLDIASSTVDSDHEGHSLGREFIKKIRLESIAIMHSVGKPV
jgi:hypothetical protein